MYLLILIEILSDLSCNWGLYNTITTFNNKYLFLKLPLLVFAVSFPGISSPVVDLQCPATQLNNLPVLLTPLPSACPCFAEVLHVVVRVCKRRSFRAETQR